MTLYHGGRAGLREVLTPAKSGVRSRGPDMHRIYLTDDPAIAAQYAATAAQMAGEAHGAVYEVEPLEGLCHEYPASREFFASAVRVTTVLGQVPSGR